MKLRDGPNWIYPLDGKTQIYIGRREDNDIRLNDPLANTRQAVIYWENGRYKINNLSARMPTTVNGRPITKQNVGDGNTIQMGRTKLIFRDRGRA
jgi:pSer/pThr/pTyr-binding forkhead associated (FHA) protein